MDNQAVKDDTKRLNSTEPKSKVLVRMESAVSSVTSTQEIIETTSSPTFNATARAGKIRAMISNCSKRMLVAIICLLLIGVLTVTTLYVMEYHKKGSITTIMQTAPPKECYEVTPETVLDEVPKELVNIMPVIESKIRSAAAIRGFKAVSYGIAYNGKLWWTYHYGRRNFSNSASPPPDNDTPYPVASLTKLFTAVMLMKLVENGVIKSTDDPINKYDPEFSVKNPFNSEHISFRQLLCMTTGLPREAPCNPPTEFNFCPYDTKEMWKRIAKVELQTRPNTSPVYSNLGFGVLGRVLERILNGTRYEDWMKSEIFGKLGLTNTGFDVRKRYTSIPASQDSDLKVSRITDWGWLRPAGGLYASLNDIHKFANELIERLNTTLLKKSSKRRIFNHGYGSPVGCPTSVWKLATGKESNSASSKRNYVQNFFSFNGLIVGYTSQIKLSPQNTLATYGLSADGGHYHAFIGLDDEIGGLIFNTVTKVLKKRESKYKAPSNMEAYVGTYKVNSYWPLIKNHVIIKIKNGKLNLQLEWFSADLSYLSPWRVKTVYTFNKYNCPDAVLNTGLLNNVYAFDKPENGTNKCPGFYVRSISTFGYVSFIRV